MIKILLNKLKYLKIWHLTFDFFLVITFRSPGSIFKTTNKRKSENSTVSKQSNINYINLLVL